MRSLFNASVSRAGVIVFAATTVFGCAKHSSKDPDPQNPDNAADTSDASDTHDAGTKSGSPTGTEGPSDGTSTGPHPDQETVAPSWENFGDAFLRNWCKGCHSPHLEGKARFGAPAGVDLVTIEDLRQWQARVKARATGDAPSMPPAGGPSPEERARLLQWLSSGAPTQAQVDQP